MLMLFVRIFQEVHILATQLPKTEKAHHAIKVLYCLNIKVCKLQRFGIDSNIEQCLSAVN